ARYNCPGTGRTGLGGSPQNIRPPQVRGLEDERRAHDLLSNCLPNLPLKVLICLIGHGDDLLEGLELGNAEDRPKNLVTANFHLSSDILEDCGFEEVSLLQSRVRGLLPPAE